MDVHLLSSDMMSTVTLIPLFSFLQTMLLHLSLLALLELLAISTNSYEAEHLRHLIGYLRQWNCQVKKSLILRVLFIFMLRT